MATGSPGLLHQNWNPDEMNMEMALSPFRQADDENDGDSIVPDIMRELSVDPMQDDFAEENALEQDDINETDTVIEQHEVNPDDDMLEEEKFEQDLDINTDFSMEGGQEREALDEDEDILYEEDDLNEDTDITLQDHEANLLSDHVSTDVVHMDAPVTDDDHHIEQKHDVENDQLGQLHDMIPHIEEKQDISGNTPEHNMSDNRGDETSVEQRHEDDKSVNIENDDSSHRVVEENQPKVSTTHQGEQEQTTHQQQEETVTHDNIHPISINYVGEEMSLFPPSQGDESHTFLLSETSLVDSPLDNLLGACREVLAESIGDDDEVVLDIPSLGLHICQDSKYSAQLTLSQVLDVYLGLTNNEQTEDVGPLHCTLSTRVSLASQYAYLLDSAHQGRTYSEVVADHADTPQDFGEAAAAETMHSESVVRTQPEVEAGTEHVAEVLAAQEYVEPDPQVHSEAANPSQVAVDDLVAIPQQQQTAATEAPPTDHEVDDEGHLVENPDIDTAIVPADLAGPHEDPNEIEPQTASSHTIGLEPHDEAEAGPNDDEDPSPEVHDFEQNEDLWPDQEYLDNDEIEDLQPPNAESGPGGHTEDMTHSGAVVDQSTDLAEDLFDEDDITETIAEDQVEDAAPTTEANDARSEEPRTQQKSEPIEEQGKTTNGHPPDPAMISTGFVDTPPTTPSKVGLGKRKVDDDDDFGLLDIETPDPKRRRPT